MVDAAKSFFSEENVRIVIAMIVTFLSTIGVTTTLPSSQEDHHEVERMMERKVSRDLDLMLQILEVKLDSKIAMVDANMPPQATRERIEALEDAVRGLDKDFRAPTRKW